MTRAQAIKENTKFIAELKMIERDLIGGLPVNDNGEECAH